MACMCGHSKTRHQADQGGRCTALASPRHGQCFCQHFTSELENERRVRLAP